VDITADIMDKEAYIVSRRIHPEFEDSSSTIVVCI
jgi:hypothetical protein